MQIWVDADACPVAIKEILYRAAERVEVRLTLVANHTLRVPPSRWIRAVQVARGFDVADNAILGRLSPGDLVVTADIPLAAEVIAAGGEVISPRGERFTTENIEQRLAQRNFLDQLRGTGEITGGPPPLGAPERQAFANALDRLLTRRAAAD
ncbi:YaiI/YqxD family protein [Thiococcus pfennigii]|uniref:YaiI/YqxD family protein n=1 Tax=Thiococcus pfennigii TaxID=1057 RepID=UPI001903AAC4|nr:YaiI/YqxD family protein [Thiococcus pfennigii]MBK1700692.1 DUF188 domain-containing protein [Thiococcus pfennigii]MBK1730360.1 DUF188 domain-containing protein [Thiococcus pfennigii]